jgi:transcriptional regulator with XRE-family HTH domain
MSMEPVEHPAKKIRFLLYTHSMTHEQLAHELGVTTESLREIVDELCVPTPHLLHRICNYFGVNDTYFATTSVQSSPTLPPPKTGTTTVLNAIPRPRPGGAPAGSRTTERAGSVSRTAGAGAPAGARKKRKLDLAEMVARHQALLECLVAKRVIGASDYQKRLEAARAKLLERQKGR